MHSTHINNVTLFFKYYLSVVGGICTFGTQGMEGQLYCIMINFLQPHKACTITIMSFQHYHKRFTYYIVHWLIQEYSKNVKIHTQLWVYHFIDTKKYTTHYVSFSHRNHELTVVPNCRKTRFCRGKEVQ